MDKVNKFKKNVHNIDGDIMNFFNILLRSIFSILALFFLTKIMGRKQISQLNLYDYVVGITIGSVAAEVSTNLDTNFWGGILVMLIYSLVSIFFSYSTEKSIILRRFIIGVPYILIENGKILEFCAESGTYTFDKGTEPSIFTGNLGKGIIDTTAYQTIDTDA